MYPLEFLGLLFLPFLMALCTIAGIGGGGIVIPFCMTFFVFDTRNAISISGFSLLFCSILRFVKAFHHKHPDKESVVIDYGLATVMFPTVMMGSHIGIQFNVVVPTLYLQIGLTMILVGMAIQSSIKARQIVIRENIVMNRNKEKSDKDADVAFEKPP